tara:strand:- start:101 stop:697 length:597 start_codon:yes stop_codon:yes gene_type:complete
MLLKFIRFSIIAILKTYCENINIRNIKFDNNKFRSDKINNFIIEAENVIYNNLYINKIKILIFNLSIEPALKKIPLSIKNFNIDIISHLSKKNIEQIIFNPKWIRFRTLIEDFISSNTNIISIDLEDNYIYFNYKKNKSFSRLGCHLKIEENNLILQKIIQKSMISIPLDPIIKIKHLEINNNSVILELSSKITLEKI